MSKVFGTIAAVILAFSAFVAWKNQVAYKKQIETLHTSQNVEKSTKRDLAKAQKRLKDAEEAKTRHIAKKVEVDKELEVAVVALAKAEKVVVALEEEYKNKETEIANADEILKGLPNPKELVPKVKGMRSDLAEATSAIATEEAKLANLTRQDKTGKERIKAIRELMRLQTSGESFPNLSTRISSVYRSWGFVILSAGDKQGVVSGSILNVMRDGEVIGKLKVTAVESGRSAADIVLDSVPEGISLHSGDKVVAAHKSEKKTAPAPKAAPKAAPNPAPAPVQ